MPTISVCLASYNGADYIEEQLNSIVKQSLRPMEIVISDDCSVDRTIEVVENFIKTSTVPVRLFRNDSNVGFVDNFLNAAKHCMGELIAFCDQDDVWDASKLQYCHEWFCVDKSIMLVVHNAWITDANLRLIERNGAVITYWSGKTKIYAPLAIDPRQLASPGCCFLFRSSLVKNFDFRNRPRALMSDYRYGLTHDQWIVFLASAIGCTVWDRRPLMRYRLHNNNKCGITVEETFSDTVHNLRISKLRSYKRIHDVMLEWEDCLTRLANNSGSEVERARLRYAAHHWGTMAAVWLERDALYKAEAFPDRISAYLNMVVNGRYRKRPLGGLGTKSMFKDLAYICGLI